MSAGPLPAVTGAGGYPSVAGVGGAGAGAKPLKPGKCNRKVD